MIKQYTGGVWNTVDKYKMYKSQEVESALPLVMLGDGEPLTDYKIYGANGGVGEQTENLFTRNNSTNGYLLDDGSIVSPHENLFITDYIPVSAEFVTQFSDFGEGVSMGAPSMCFYDSNKDFISGEQFSRLNPKTFSVPTNAVYLRTCYRTVYTWTMLVAGSSAPESYIPYGYRIPMTVGDGTTSTDIPIYLGEVPSERYIKKYEFTGQENWLYSSGAFYSNIADIDSKGLRKTTFNCSHYELINDGRAFADVTNNSIYTGAAGLTVTYVYIFTDEYATITSFKAYLAQQLANGTPVTIWYPLRTPSTGILNEPLRKIGSYADSVSGTGLPTLNGTTVYDCDLTVKPSNMEAEADARWLPYTPKQYDNGAWK